MPEAAHLTRHTDESPEVHAGGAVSTHATQAPLARLPTQLLPLASRPRPRGAGQGGRHRHPAARRCWALVHQLGRARLHPCERDG